MWELCYWDTKKEFTEHRGLIAIRARKTKDHCDGDRNEQSITVLFLELHK
jgi:hypothetical protein